jgi:hypothetical protein
MRPPGFALLAAISCLSLAPLARPQDSHYWTNQYGTRATLLGGAVIGSVLDLSGTYYNPGGLSLIKDPDTLMAAKILQYPRLTLVGNGGENVPLNSHNPGPAPSLIAGTIRLRGPSKHWFGYSYVSRQEVKLGVSVSSTGVRDVLPDVPGDEDYASQFRLDEKVSERWFGLTWSTRVSKRVGIGVTQYLAVRSQRANLQELVEARMTDGRVAVALGARQYQYQHLRVLWKIGLACDLDPITLGLTLTTPSLGLYGDGSTGINSTVVALDMDGDGDPDDFLAADYQDRQDSTYRTPFSVAAGMTFKLRKIRFYWSTEWFASVSPYIVVDAGDFAAQSTGETLSADVTQELASVFNLGLGLEWLYSSRFKGYASFTTDYSAKRPGTVTNLSLTDWDIHHFITGAEFAVRKSRLTAGLGLSFGRREIGSRPAILERAGVEGMWDPFEGLRFRYTTYRLIVGFAI